MEKRWNGMTGSMEMRAMTKTTELGLLKVEHGRTIPGAHFIARSLVDKGLRREEDSSLFAFVAPLYLN